MHTQLDREELIETQEELSSLIGCPGFERRVAQYILARVEPKLDKAWIDTNGNVLGIREAGEIMGYGQKSRLDHSGTGVTGAGRSPCLDEQRDTPADVGRRHAGAAHRAVGVTRNGRVDAATGSDHVWDDPAVKGGSMG